MAVNPGTDDLRAALCDLIRRLHPDMNADAAIDELMRGHMSARAIPEMDVARLSQRFPERTAELIHLIPGMARATLRNNYPPAPFIRTPDEAARFLRGHYIGLSYEHCYLLLLRKNQRLIREVMIQSGTLDSLPFYPRNIVEAALTYEADAIVLSHNHPGGTPFPSQADVDSTWSLIEALQPLAIPLVDHIIIAGEDSLSLREMESIPADVWEHQPNSCSTLMKNWLKPARSR